MMEKLLLFLGLEKPVREQSIDDMVPGLICF